MITTIIFDLAEVYLKGLLGVENFLVTKLRIPAKEIHQKFHGEDLTDFFQGRISEEKYFEKIIIKNKWEISVDFLKDAVRKNFEEIEGTREIIEKLKKKGYKLGLVSVHSKEWIDYCEKKFDYHKLFDSVLYSFEIGICKPDKKIYEKILQEMQVKPTECLFIDDSLINIRYAKELGMNAIQFKNSSQLIEELAILSINID